MFGAILEMVLKVVMVFVRWLYSYSAAPKKWGKEYVYVKAGKRSSSNIIRATRKPALWEDEPWGRFYIPGPGSTIYTTDLEGAMEYLRNGGTPRIQVSLVTSTEAVERYTEMLHTYTYDHAVRYLERLYCKVEPSVSGWVQEDVYLCTNAYGDTHKYVVDKSFGETVDSGTKSRTMVFFA